MKKSNTKEFELRDYIDFHLPENKTSTKREILILGNTKGFFGKVKDGELSIESSNENILENNYNWLLSECINFDSHVTIIGEKDLIDGYYKPIFNKIVRYFNTKIKCSLITLDKFSKVKNIKFSNKLYESITKDLMDGRNMKFDVVIMNPPYEGNLHLKILENVVKMLRDESSVCINLSPIRWLQDPFKDYKQGTDYKRFKDTVNHIKSLDVIDTIKAFSLFGIKCCDLGIYEITKNNKEYKDVFSSTLLYKIVSFCWNHRLSVDKNMKDGWRVKWPIISTRYGHGFGDKIQRGEFYLLNLKYFYEGMKDGKPWYEHFVKNKYTKTTSEITYSVKFESEQECVNFCNSMKTDFCKFCQEMFINDIHINDYSIPYMVNEINPRTGLKGYKSEWTDEDFYKFFNITEDEQKIIESTIEE